MEEEKREKMRVKALKTAQRVQITAEESRLKHDENILSEKGNVPSLDGKDMRFNVERTPSRQIDHFSNPALAQTKS